jgi:nucleotide-binding universal stress UspA family protein
MIATEQEERARRRRPLEASSARKARRRYARDFDTGTAPIVAAVEPQTARVTADTAARIARELGAPLVFVTVRPPLPAVLGEPYYQRRLSRDLCRSRKALDAALSAASRHGVMSYGEIVEGEAATEIVAFATARKARLLVIGARRRRLVPSVSRRVIGTAEQPVVVAAPLVAAYRWHVPSRPRAAVRMRRSAAATKVAAAAR